jgi:hypothetical protein
MRRYAWTLAQGEKIPCWRGGLQQDGCCCYSYSNMNSNTSHPVGGNGSGGRRREKFHRVPSFRTGKASKAVNLNSGFDCAVSVYQAGVCHGALVHDISKFILLLPGLFGPNSGTLVRGLLRGQQTPRGSTEAREGTPFRVLPQQSITHSGPGPLAGRMGAAARHDLRSDLKAFLSVQPFEAGPGRRDRARPTNEKQPLPGP